MPRLSWPRPICKCVLIVVVVIISSLVSFSTVVVGGEIENETKKLNGNDDPIRLVRVIDPPPREWR
jgi:hypothetical protein